MDQISMIICATKVAVLLLTVFSSLSFATDQDVFLSAMPSRYGFVDGDHESFRAHHWMKDGYAGGIERLEVRHLFPGGGFFSLDGRALIDQNDWKAELSFSQEGLGFLRFDFLEFRKYFDGSGPVHRRFRSFQVNDTDKELALDIGRLGFSGGLEVGGWPLVTVGYEREFKDGAKSRLTRTAVRESDETRNIGPSWQEVDEVTDSFLLKANQTIAGFEVTGEQKWEFVRSEFLREERNLSSTTAAADRKIRRQDQAPETDLSTSTLQANRRFLNDRLHLSAAYRFAHMDNREFESIVETNANGVVTNFSNPKQIRDARADNDYDTHTWVGSLTWGPLRWLNMGARFKAEAIHRESSSSYPADASPNSAGGSTPNGTIDQQVVSLNENKALRWGEAFHARFTGIPRTALYAELELEQARIRMVEDRKDLLGANANETFNRLTITDLDRGAATLGGRFYPWSFLEATTHLRYRRNNSDYDDQQETAPGASTARSAFMDGQSVETNEVTARLAWRPRPWFAPSFRYQLRDDDFATRAENEPITKTSVTSRIITADLTWQPSEKLFSTFSFSRQMLATQTPARLSASANTPSFHADVDTWLIHLDYAPRTALTLGGSCQYSRADNFNDFSATGLPLGVENDRLDLTARVHWSFAQDALLGTEYAFYHYQGNSNAEANDYNAHVIWLTLSKKF